MPVEVSVALVAAVVASRVVGADFAEWRQPIRLHVARLRGLLHCLLGQSVETRVRGQVVHNSAADEGLPGRALNSGRDGKKRFNECGHNT